MNRKWVLKIGNVTFSYNRCLYCDLLMVLNYDEEKNIPGKNDGHLYFTVTCLSNILFKDLGFILNVINFLLKGIGLSTKF